MEINLRKQIFTKGTRVILMQDLQDPYKPIPKGAEGAVESVDDIGTVHVLWDNYGRLGVLKEEKIQVFI